MSPAAPSSPGVGQSTSSQGTSFSPPGAAAPTIALAIPALLISGAMQTSFMSINNAFILGRTEAEYHGRIMSLFSLDRGLMPMGAALGGFLAEFIGPSEGLMIMASCCLIATLAIAVLVPSIRRIE